jgi:hypothetical protein
MTVVSMSVIHPRRGGSLSKGRGWLYAPTKKKLISLITNKLWSFFSTLGHQYIPQKFQVRTIIPSGCSAFGNQCIRIPIFHQTIFLFIFVFTLNLIAKTVNDEFSIQNSKVYKTMIKKISWAVHHH